MKKNILIIGPICGNKGGVYVHIKRLVNLINKEHFLTYIDESRTINSDVLNIREAKIFSVFKLFKKSDIIFIHTGVWYLRTFYLVLAKLMAKETITTFHAWMHGANFFLITITKISLKLSTKIVAVNQNIINILNLKKAILKPAFIPPSMSTNETELDKKILQFISEVGCKIISANAFRIETYQGRDLYGIDMAIELAREIKKNKDKIKIVFIISTIQNSNKEFEDYSKTIEREKLQSQILLFPQEISFVELIKKSDLVIRPTATDGDALTVREALYLNTAVVASDVVDRPEGTFIYKNASVKSLYEKSLEALKTDLSKKQKNAEDESRYKQFYLRLLE